MPRPVGRPPDSLLAQFRAWYLNPVTTPQERDFFFGFVAALDQELAERTGKPMGRRRREPETPAGERVLIESHE